MRTLSEEQWRPHALAHRQRVSRWTEPRLDRRRAGIRHPVDDFLWEYYRFRPAQLSTWHPGLGTALAGEPEIRDHRDYLSADGAWYADLAAGGTPVERLQRNLLILQATADRPARTGCFGMHEWAMVHGLQPDRVRHEQVPLRLAPEQIRDVVADVGLRCTHFDAYRFFTASAQPLQRPLSRAGQVDDEQPGCIHAGMDLYRYAYEAAAFVGSDLVVECFEHARAARQLDMQASPYDLTGFGLSPLPLETPEGRRRYAVLQQHLADRARPLRDELIRSLEQVLRSASIRTPEAAESR